MTAEKVAAGSDARVQIGDDFVRFINPTATYAKLTHGTQGVRGYGPFDLTFRKDGISGTVEGATRTLVTTWPEAIVRPMYRMDGTRFFAGWADDHSIGKGWPTPQFAIAFGVLDGRHTVEIGEWEFPPLPEAPAMKTASFE